MAKAIETERNSQEKFVMLIHPSTKYQPAKTIELSDRTWPNKTITTPPIWLSTDLRDGNQALSKPMDIAQKLRLFRTLIDIGFKEIEIGFPSASQTEFDFVRHLIDNKLIPDDVTIQVLTPAREQLIHRTFQALQGIKQAIVHLYNATAPIFRKVVFNLDKPSTIRLATEAATLITTLAQQQPNTHWRFQYSPEVFTSTELPFAKEICNAVLDRWQPTLAAKAIINLPASVEVSTPNVFADQVEWMHRHLNYRESVVLCVHPHNDRGCSVAAAELAQMAGAQRVEGCLFGNGERTGNVDLVTLAMNLYTQGISPKLDFSQLNDIMHITQDCTQIPVHPRHPYAGDLVFTAFSGSHQDAIKKGFALRSAQLDQARLEKAKQEASLKDSPAEVLWTIPYLPMDPADVGRSYESIVRVNSQSGKGGVAFLLEKTCGLSLPKKLQIDFSRIVQSTVEASGTEMTAHTIWKTFCQNYQQETTPIQYASHQSTQLAKQTEIKQTERAPGNYLTQISAQLKYHHASTEVEHTIEATATGNGPIDAFVRALNKTKELDYLGKIQLSHYEERIQHQTQHQKRSHTSHQSVSRSTNSSADSSATCLVEIRTQQGSAFGLGIHQNIVIASFQAILSALNRQIQSNSNPTNHLHIRNPQSIA